MKLYGLVETNRPASVRETCTENGRRGELVALRRVRKVVAATQLLGGELLGACLCVEQAALQGETVSVKTKATGFVALAAVAATGFYFLNPGTKVDTSKDRLLRMNVEWDPSPRSITMQIRVMINGRERSQDTKIRSPWNDEVWMRPGDVVILTAKQSDPGYITCAASADGIVYGPHSAGPTAFAICTVVAK